MCIQMVKMLLQTDRLCDEVYCSTLRRPTVSHCISVQLDTAYSTAKTRLQVHLDLVGVEKEIN